MTGITTIIGSLSALMIMFGNFPVKIAAAQDQPIKRTELHRSDLADVVAKKQSSILRLTGSSRIALGSKFATGHGQVPRQLQNNCLQTDVERSWLMTCTAEETR